MWDGVYSAAQAQRGADTFAQNCAGCHGRASGVHGPLWGAGFWRRWREASVGDLYAYLRDNMPNDDPGDLQDAEYLDLIAYILSRNDFPAGAHDLAAAAVASIAIVSKVGPALLPDSTLVAITGCLARTGSGDWVLESAGKPLRVDSEGAAAPAPSSISTSATRSYALKYVMGSLEAFAGHRVRITGLLIGDGGASGINFMTASDMAGRCGPG